MSNKIDEMIEMISALKEIGSDLSVKGARKKIYDAAPESMKKELLSFIKIKIQDLVLTVKEQFMDDEILIFIEMLQNETNHDKQMKQKKEKLEKICINCDTHDLIEKENYINYNFTKLKEKCKSCVNYSLFSQKENRTCTNCKNYIEHDEKKNVICSINKSEDIICLKGEYWRNK